MDGLRGEGWPALRRAASDRRSGAREIALRAAEALAALPRADLLEAVRALVQGHPSMAPVWRLGSDVLEAPDHPQAAGGFARAILTEAEAVAMAAAPLLRFPEVIAHSYSSTLVAALVRTGAKVLCARSEPGGEGARMAERLGEAGATARVVDDDEALASAGSGAPVVTGADAVGPGGVVNKVRTAALAEAARASGAGCHVLAGSHKLLAVDLPADPPFERVAVDLLAAVVTEDGPLDPRRLQQEAARHPIHPALEDLLSPR